jgi:hypothetical protein
MATTTTNFGWDIPQSTDLVKDGATAIAALGQDIDTALVDLKGGTTGQVLAKASGTDLDFSWVAQDDSNAIQNAIVDAKGDLIGATAADTPARLAVGTNGQVLTADSSAATGLAWATPSASGGDIVRIATTSFSASSAVNLNDIFSTTYTNYIIVLNITSASGTGNLNARLRVSGADNTTSVYSSQYDYNLTSGATAGTTKTSATSAWQFSFISDAPLTIPFTISQPFQTAQTFASTENFMAGDGYKVDSAGWFNNTTSFTGMTFIATTGNITGEAIIYGMKRA